MTIIISKDNKNAEIVKPSGIDKEDFLQQYIYNNPESIPLYDVYEDMKLIILAREFPTKSGPVDALGIDKDGGIYLIETKRYNNPDKREVVAQVLDDGVSMWKNINYDDFIAILENEIQKIHAGDLNQILKDHLGSEDHYLTTHFFKCLDSNKFICILFYFFPYFISCINSSCSRKENRGARRHTNQLRISNPIELFRIKNLFVKYEKI